MNRTWYEVKVKYTKQLENGTIKRVTEPYLVDAVSFTESEARIYKEVCETCQGECSVEAIKKDNIVDIFLYEDSDVWYRCTINRIDYDDSGKERKVKEAMMVTASSVQEAAQRIQECLSAVTFDFDIHTIKETPTQGVFSYTQASELA